MAPTMFDYESGKMASCQPPLIRFTWPRTTIATTIGCCVIFVLLVGGPLHALDPGKHLTQYIHKSWKIEDGSVAESMSSITQTSDGFLWFTSASGGLYRFDGVRFSPRNLVFDGEAVKRVDSVYADQLGGLWAVTNFKEIMHLKNGRVVSHFEFHGAPMQTSFSGDADGSIWVMLANPQVDTPLCHVTDQATKCFGRADGISIPNGIALVKDGKGGFWLGGQEAVEHWGGGISQVYSIEALKSNGGDPVEAITPDPHGSALWVGLTEQGPGLGLGRLQNGVFKSFVAPGFDGSKFAVSSMIRDRGGDLWVGTIGDGLFRISGNVVEHYGRKDGLSGDDVVKLLEDREGILWVTTKNGIDSFRDPRVVTFSNSEGLGPDEALGVLASRDGSVWVANGNSLDHIEKGGAVSSIRWGKGLPGDQVTAMLEDHTGNLWMGIYDGLYLLRNGHFHRISEPDHQPLGLIIEMTEDADGNIWAQCLGKSHKTVRIRDFQIQEEFLNSQVPLGVIAPDPNGGIWIGRSNQLLLFRHGKLQKFAIDAAGINYLAVQADGSVLVASGGLVGWRKGKIQRMTAKNGLPGNDVYSFIEDSQKRWWIYTDRGIVEFADSDLQNWWANPETIIQTKLYDVLDGARPGGHCINPVALSPDGRVWFVNRSVVEMVDPSKLSLDGLPVMTYVESLTVDRKELQASDNLTLPPHPREVQIDYTSPVLAVPQRVKFRYRLDPYDHDWHDAGTRRQAYYTDLPPGKYSFRVIACNSDGVWNDGPAKLDFSVAPAYYQTNWFRAACGAAFMALLWGAYELRVRQLRHQFALTLEARVAERTRIARDLHDTLLQSFQGILLKFQSVLKLLPERPIEAKDRLERALDQATGSVTEARDAVQGLRSTTINARDLGELIAQVGEEIKNEGTDCHCAVIQVQVEGAPRDLKPLVRDEVYRIACEALRNAVRHAQAREITVEIQYEGPRFRLRVRDDGKGMTQETVERQPLTGHFGLPGMRERAEIIGGHIDVWSKLGSGTAIDLSLPAKVAYASLPRWSWLHQVFSRKGRDNGNVKV